LLDYGNIFVNEVIEAVHPSFDEDEAAVQYQWLDDVIDNGLPDHSLASYGLYAMALATRRAIANGLGLPPGAASRGARGLFAEVTLRVLRFVNDYRFEQIFDGDTDPIARSLGAATRSMVDTVLSDLLPDQRREIGLAILRDAPQEGYLAAIRESGLCGQQQRAPAPPQQTPASRSISNYVVDLVRTFGHEPNFVAPVDTFADAIADLAINKTDADRLLAIAARKAPQ
jgi:hypothetical protein